MAFKWYLIFCMFGSMVTAPVLAQVADSATFQERTATYSGTLEIEEGRSLQVKLNFYGIAKDPEFSLASLDRVICEGSIRLTMPGGSGDAGEGDLTYKIASARIYANDKLDVCIKIRSMFISVDPHNDPRFRSIYFSILGKDYEIGNTKLQIVRKDAVLIEGTSTDLERSADREVTEDMVIRAARKFFASFGADSSLSSLYGYQIVDENSMNIFLVVTHKRKQSNAVAQAVYLEGKGWHIMKATSGAQTTYPRMDSMFFLVPIE